MSASAILKLQAAGFTAEQVTALAELIDSQASSKSNLLEAEHRLRAQTGAFRAESLELAHGLDAKIDGVEHRLELKISDVKTDLIEWMVGISFAQVALMLTVIKLFMH